MVKLTTYNIFEDFDLEKGFKFKLYFDKKN